MKWLFIKTILKPKPLLNSNNWWRKHPCSIRSNRSEVLLCYDIQVVVMKTSLNSLENLSGGYSKLESADGKNLLRSVNIWFCERDFMSICLWEWWYSFKLNKCNFLTHMYSYAGSFQRFLTSLKTWMFQHVSRWLLPLLCTSGCCSGKFIAFKNYGTCRELLPSLEIDFRKPLMWFQLRPMTVSLVLSLVPPYYFCHPNNIQFGFTWCRFNTI